MNMHAAHRLWPLALIMLFFPAGFLSTTGCSSDEENATENIAFYGTYTYWQESERCAGVTKSSLAIGKDEDRIKTPDRDDQYIYLPETETSYEYEKENDEGEVEYWYKVSISGRSVTMEQEKGDQDWSYSITMVFDQESNNTGTMSGYDYYKLWDCRSFNGTFRRD